MAKPTTAQIRQAFATTIAATLTDWNVQPYYKANLTLPGVDVMPGPIDYDTAMGRGNDDVTYIVRAVVAHTNDVNSQEKLDTLLELDPSSTTSMKNAIETHDAGDGSHRSTLGGVVSDVRVVSASEYKTYQPTGGAETIGVEWTVTVVP